jgi:hypothetical protein
MPLQVESLVLHEEAVRKGMVELDAKMSQFLVEYFLPESDNSYAGSTRGQSFQQSSPSLYQQQQQQQMPSTKNVAPQRPIMHQPVRRCHLPLLSSVRFSSRVSHPALVFLIITLSVLQCFTSLAVEHVFFWTKRSSAEAGAARFSQSPGLVSAACIGIVATLQFVCVLFNAHHGRLPLL